MNPRQVMRQVQMGGVWALIALVGWWLYSPKPADHVHPSSVPSDPDTSQALRPLPDVSSLGLDAAKVALGERLFADTRFSADNSVSCASCHNPANAGVDNMPKSVGAYGRMGVINSPTMFNSGFNFVQFWDGRAKTLEEQANFPITSPTEFVSNWNDILKKLAADASLVQAFKPVYADGLTAANVLDAIAEYERSLVTPSRFDRYLRGETQALNAAEIRGYELFQTYGCVACHQGRNIGGNMFQKLGVARNYFQDRPTTKADQGRYNVTHEPQDMHVFKVPSLRNVARTAPYFHDASAETLDAAVTTMARYQLGVELPAADRADLVAFLNSLTGVYRGKSL